MGNTALGSLTELQILNYAFLKNSVAIFSENGLTADYFTTYKPHFEFLMQYYQTYNRLPSKETFQVKFDGKWDWISVTDSEDYLIAQLREAKLYRDVIADYSKMADLIKSEKTDKAIELIGKEYSLREKEREEDEEQTFDNVMEQIIDYESSMEGKLLVSLIIGREVAKRIGGMALAYYE